MALTEEQAKEKQARLDKSGAQRHAHHMAYWTLAMVYDHGPQWGYTAPESGQLQVRYLRQIVDPNRKDIRVAMNRIHQSVNQIRAMLNPQSLKVDVEIRGGVASSRNLAYAAEQIQSEHLKAEHGLSQLRYANYMRCVLGSAVIRRTLRRVGPGKDTGVPAPNGGTIFTWPREIGMSVHFPWEFQRDASAQTVHPERDEEIFSHIQPRTTDWISRTFGKPITSETKLGALLETQRQMHVASGHPLSQGAADSELPAVMVHETYFADPESAESWPWLLLSYTDQARDAEKYETLFFGRNPFYGLPFRVLVYDPLIAAPWGAGIPHLQMASQDITNIAFTWLVRLMQEGGGKWMYQKGTLTTPWKDLSARLDEAIEYEKPHQWSTGPERAPAPQIPPAAMTLLEMAPNWMRETLNLAEVQLGMPVKRGEAGKAYEIRLGAAERPIEDLRTGDELVLSELLYGDLVDVVKHYRKDQLQKLVGGDTPEEDILAIKRGDPLDTFSAVNLHPSVLRPKTPGESEERFVGLVAAQFLDPETAQWELLIQGRVTTNTQMAINYRKQLGEIDAMVAGEQVLPTLGDNHRYHIWTLKLVVGSPRWATIAEESRTGIIDHLLGHITAMQQEEALMAGGMVAGPEPVPQPGAAAGIGMEGNLNELNQSQGSPPSSAMDLAAQGPQGAPAEPAMAGTFA